MAESTVQLAPEQQALLLEAGSLFDQAKACREKGLYARAEVLLRESLEKRMTVLGQDDGTAKVLFELGFLCETTAKEEEAIKLYGQAITILEKTFYAGHGLLAPILEHQADCYIKEEKLLEAEPILKRALEIYEKTLSVEHRQTLDCARKLARLCQKLGKLQESETILTKALKQLDTPLGPAEEFRHDLALVHEAQGKMAEAEKSFKEAVKGFQSRRNYPGLAKCCASYAEFLRKQNRKTESEAIETIAEQMRAAKDMAHHDVFSATLLRA